MLPHARRVLTALDGNLRRQVRIALRRPPRPRVAVLGQPVEDIIERHAWICGLLDRFWPAGMDVGGQRVCEVGAGDCLAAVSHLLARGAAHALVVEHTPPVVNAKQRVVLEALNQRGIATRPDLVQGDPPRLDEALMTYHCEWMENYRAGAEHAFLCSFCVLEHVEELVPFFASCHRALQPGGKMMHYIDLGGHGVFEDPLPPLEFQRYADWFYTCMYPRYHRSTRRFVRDYIAAAEAAGFRQVRAEAARRADADYVQAIRPRLRPAARAIPAEELGIIEFALVAER